MQTMHHHKVTTKRRSRMQFSLGTLHIAKISIDHGSCYKREFFLYYKKLLLFLFGKSRSHNMSKRKITS